MDRIYTLPLGAYQTNCYILPGCDGQCLIVDPGYAAGTIRSFLQEKQLTPAAILLTHGHFDHVGAVRDLAAHYSCPVYLHPAELTLPAMITAGPLYYTHTYQAGDILSLAGLTLRVLHTPGHTPGSVCLLWDDILISGDTLFAGSCGRTDLPGGDWATIVKSLKQLAALEGHIQVLPGHGESTTIAAENSYNPYMR